MNYLASFLLYLWGQGFLKRLGNTARKLKSTVTGVPLGSQALSLAVTLSHFTNSLLSSGRSLVRSTCRVLCSVLVCRVSKRSPTGGLCGLGEKHVVSVQREECLMVSERRAQRGRHCVGVYVFVNSWWSFLILFRHPDIAENVIIWREFVPISITKVNFGLLYNLHVLDLKNKNWNTLVLQTVYFRETVTSAKQLSGIRLCSAIPSGVVDWLTYCRMCHDYVICEEDCRIYRERTF